MIISGKQVFMKHKHIGLFVEHYAVTLTKLQDTIYPYAVVRVGTFIQHLRLLLLFKV